MKHSRDSMIRRLSFSDRQAGVLETGNRMLQC